MNVENAVIPTPEQIKELGDGGHDRPIYMVNLLMFKKKTEYEDRRETDLTGRITIVRCWTPLSPPTLRVQ